MNANVNINMTTMIKSKTPDRIIHLLCPELSLQQVGRIRQRVVATVVHGKGKKRQTSNNDTTQNNVITKKFKLSFRKCKTCGYSDHEEGTEDGFVTDIKNGDVICSRCGTVQSESFIHEGTMGINMYRKFEGEEDRNHHGDAYNHLYSNAYNMATSLSGVRLSIGPGDNSGGRENRNVEAILRKAHKYIEMNVSEMGNGEKSTRNGYKDRQKKEAFVKMTHVGDALSLHREVLERAKELFSGFRDDRELLQQFEGTIAACLVEAFHQLSNERRGALKVQSIADSIGNDNDKKLFKRAIKRNKLHCSKFAGKGGLMLNLPQENKNEYNKENRSNSTSFVIKNRTCLKPEPPTTLAIEQKPVSSWDLNDIRSWLLVASRAISRNKFEKSTTNFLEAETLEEIEGTLVQQIFQLCDVLENEYVNKGSAMTRGKQRVFTPKVNEIGHLSIKWQHGHERGSGGAGGVGYSGIGAVLEGRGGNYGNTTTPGQILLMKTAPQFKKAIRDNDTGEAFYKELRALVGRQYAKLKEQRSEAASMKRMNQMRRKLELQTRVKS